MSKIHPAPTIDRGTARISQQEVDDLLCAAFEGGITYWCSRAETVGDWPEGAEYLSDTLSRGATILLTDAESAFDSEDEQPEVRTLTLSNFKRAVVIVAEKYGQTVADFVEDHDADSADCVVQVAVFGEVVYG